MKRYYELPLVRGPVSRLIWLYRMSVGRIKKVLKTVTGAWLYLTDAFPLPAVDLKVFLEPIQDLNGQENPYPAGGGKNLVDPNTVEIGGYNINGIAVNDGNTSYRRFALTLSAGTYTLSETVTGIIASVILVNDSPVYNHAVDLPVSITLEEDSVLKVTFKKPDSSEITEDVLFQVESGGTATAFAPYENICPITGRNTVTVARTGINRVDQTLIIEASGWSRCTIEGYTELDGVPVYTGKTGTLYNAFGRDGKTYPMTDNAFEENTQYTATLRWRTDESTANGVKVGFVYTDGTRVPYGTSPGSTTWKRQTLTSIEGKTVKAVYFTYNSNYTIMVAGFAVVKASEYNEDIVYPSNVQAVSVPLGDTVYGGTLDVTTGKLTVDRAKRIFNGTETWDRNQYYPNTFNLGRGNLAPNPANPICNYYGKKALSINYGFTIGQSINIRDPRFATSDEFKGYLADCYANGKPLEIVSTLSTPLTADLTPAQVTMLRGINNVWSDAGNIELTYYAKGE